MSSYLYKCFLSYIPVHGLSMTESWPNFVHSMPKMLCNANQTYSITATMSNKSVETLCSEVWFSNVLETFPPFPPKQCWFVYFLDSTDYSSYTTLNWEAEGIRELMLEANKIAFTNFCMWPLNQVLIYYHCTPCILCKNTTAGLGVCLGFQLPVCFRWVVFGRLFA